MRRLLISLTLVSVVLIGTGFSFNPPVEYCGSLYDKPMAGCTEVGTVQTFYEGNGVYLHKLTFSCGIYGNYTNICYNKSASTPARPAE